MIHRNEPGAYPSANPARCRLTGVSTASRNTPSTNPTIKAARHPLEFSRRLKMPNTNTVKIGGGGETRTPRREDARPPRPLVQREHNRRNLTHPGGRGRPPPPHMRWWGV